MLVHTLTWTRAGAVWAADYTEPPQPIDGVFRWILCVRDLASGRQLLALPVRAATAEATVAALACLFAEHGPPLVLKTDNGGHFTGAPVAALLERAGVLQLLSPARTPAYNGSCEAGIGAFKAFVAALAACAGRPGEWTCDLVERARVLANDTLRPWGASGPTPTEFWNQRVPIGDAERASFRARAAVLECEVRTTREEGVSDATVRRESLRRALEERGILLIRRKRVRLSIRRLMRARIS